MYLRETEPVPLPSLWDGHILADQVTGWWGKEGVGKGLLLASVHARLALGWPMPPYDHDDPDAPEGLPPSQSIMIEAEDDTSEVWRRVAAAAGPQHQGEALRRVFDMSQVPRKSADGGQMTSRFSVPDDLPLLAQQIGKMNRHDFEKRDLSVTCEGCGATAGQACAVLGPVRLVSIGPVTSVTSVSPSWSTWQVRRKLIDPMNDVARATGAGIVIVGHFWRNTTPQNFRDKMGGSKAWLDALRLVNVIWPHPDRPEVGVLAPLKSNYGEPGDGQVQFMVQANGYADPDAHVIYRQPDTGQTPVQRNARIAQRIVAELESAERPVPVQQLAAWMGYEASLIRQVAMQAAKAGLLTETTAGLMLPEPKAIEAAPARKPGPKRSRPARPAAPAKRPQRRVASPGCRHPWRQVNLCKNCPDR